MNRPTDMLLFNDGVMNDSIKVLPKEGFCFDNTACNSLAEKKAIIKQSESQKTSEINTVQEKKLIKEKLAEELIKTEVKSMVSTIVQETITNAKKTAQNRRYIINHLANLLFNAFLHENIYYT